ncbi:MAG: threonine synthase [Gaiellales bacterium]
MSASTRTLGLIRRFRDRLPAFDDDSIVSIGEGSTPLIHAPRLGARLGVDLHLKFEGLNPTGSFKDRGMTTALSAAKQDGAKAVICASTGNTSASAAAYAARAGIRCVVVIPGGKVALGKLAQAQVAGAQVVQIDGSFDDALRMVRVMSEEHPITLVNNLNPYRLEGQKTAAWEIIEDLGRQPEWMCLPVGNGGNITAYWRGYTESLERGDISALPRMLGAQAEGSAAMVRGEDVLQPETIATAIRIGAPVRREEAAAAATDSHGGFAAASDREILNWFGHVVRDEGVFCEPSSAASLAGLANARRDGLVPEGAEVVCVLTGNGLKDPDNAIAESAPPVSIPAERDALERIVLGS